MNDTSRPEIPYAVEGITDEAVMERLLTEAGATPGTCYGKNGKDSLLSQLDGYNAAARCWPWIVLVDLDSRPECAPEAVSGWLPARSPNLVLRVAVRAVESWLLADTDRFASFFGVAHTRIPTNPDELMNPKRRIVDLVSRSRKPTVKRDIVPRPGSGRAVGPGYVQQIVRYVRSHDDGWRPGVAAGRSDSLARCRRALERAVDAASPGCRT